MHPQEYQFVLSAVNETGEGPDSQPSERVFLGTSLLTNSSQSES